MQELVTEVSSIGSCRHRHVLAIKGIHVSKQNILMVYDYMPNGSLDDHLFAPLTSSPTSSPPQGCSPSLLDWNTRQNIALGTAKGLAYLHEVRSTFLENSLRTVTMACCSLQDRAASYCGARFLGLLPLRFSWCLST